MVMARENPTNEIDVSFPAYLNNRKTQINANMDGNIPNYAYGADYSMRQKIHAIPGAFMFFKAMTSTVVPKKRQEYLINSLKVGPNQFPDIYEHTVECARILGCGIPTTFIENDPIANAGAYASEDGSPVITITSGFIERFTSAEVKAVIGHEMGHIQNNHTIYKVAINFIQGAAAMTIPGVGAILSLATTPIKVALMAWNRAGEITADRAGMICCDDPNDIIMQKAKGIYGATLNRDDVNIDEIIKQYDTIRSTPVRMLEAFGRNARGEVSGHTHPIGVRRILALQTFKDSEILYKWRPEWKEAGRQYMSKQELDARCTKIVGVVRSEERSGR